jgi:hypothetical protein
MLTIEELLRRALAAEDPGDRRRAVAEFAAACRRADSDPREEQRIRDIADLLDQNGPAEAAVSWPPRAVPARGWPARVAAAAACALLAGGAVLGAAFAGSRLTGGIHPAASSGAFRATAVSPAPGPAPSSFAPVPAGPPAVVALQPFGDQHTIFVIHGANWQPGTALTIALAGLGVSPIHPVADDAGSFNYAVNQDHEFAPGLLPPRAYEVIVSGAGGQRATLRFTVRSGPPDTPQPAGTLHAKSPP